MKREKSSLLETARRHEEYLSPEARSPPDNLTARKLILANGVPRRKQDMHALEELNELNKHLAFCRVLL